MKKIYVTIISFILQLSIQAQWMNTNPIPAGNSLRSVFFPNDSIGWIAGSDGFITKTSDSGVTWNQQISNTANTLKSIYFISDNKGWIVGESGKILYTNNGGANWTSQNSGTLQNLNSIYFLNDNMGWIGGDNGTILLTTNGGIRWFSKSSGTSLSIFDITFINDLIGYAVGGDGAFQELIIKTLDGGNSWIPVPSGGEGVLYSVSFIDSNHGWAVGFNKKIIKTTDGGSSWTVQNLSKRSNSARMNTIDGMGGLRSVYFKDLYNGWAVGGSNEYDRTIYVTTDGGTVWTNKYFGLEEYDLFSIAVTSSGKSWAVGGGGSIFYSETGEDWSQQYSGTSLYNADDIYNISFVDENIGFASGKRNDFITGSGLVLKTTNGGNTWLTSMLEQESGEPNKALFFTDENNGWTAGYSTGIKHTTDGGATWNVQSLGIGFTVSSILFTDPQTGFVTGEGIHKTTDGGNTWSEKFSGNINSVFFTAPLIGWGIGDNIVFTSDAGETWSEQTNTGGNSIYFINSFRGWAVGNGGTIRSTEDGGITWTVQTSGTTVNLSSVHFIDEMNGWISGDGGAILFTSDGGTSWNAQNTGTTNAINKVYFSTRINGWAGGEAGILLKYDIVQPPFISVISPNGGETLHSGDLAVIRWEDNINDNVRIILYKGGNRIKNITGNTQSDGYFEWKIKNLPSGNDYKIFIQSVFDPSINDLSETEFSIAGKDQKFIVLTSPIGGEKWRTGDVQQIRWNNNFAESVEISLWKGDEEIIKINDNLNNTGNFSWVIPSGLESSGNYYIKVASSAQPLLFDINDSCFSIYNPDNTTKAQMTDGIIPLQNSLSQNYPNPFNPTTNISFSLSQSGFISLKVYDISGREVASLINEERPAGNYSIKFDGNNLASGVYFCILKNADFVATKKLLLVK